MNSNQPTRAEQIRIIALPSRKNWKHLFCRSLAALAPRLSFTAHGHHLWPDTSLEAQIAAWHVAARLAGKKWDRVLGPHWVEAQGHVATELNLPNPEAIAFAGNAHDFLIRIVSAFPRRPARILTSDQEFLSAMRQFRRWQETGAAVISVAKSAEIVNVAAAGDFDLIYLSQVFYDTGLESDWRQLASLARPDGPWVVVDGYHGFMALPTDLSDVASHVFYIAGGYKYAMSGEGVGILHAPPDFAPRPEITGWFAQTGRSDPHPDHPVWFPEDARRFMGSTFDPSGLYRFNAVRRMLAAERLDTAIIADHAWRLQMQFLQSARLPDLELANHPGSRPGARFLAYRGAGAEAVRARLETKGIDVDARGQLLRIGFSVYHDAQDVDRLIAATWDHATDQC